MVKSSLTAEEREKVRQVMAKAWNDPEVVRAREDVRGATEGYRRALRQAVARIDPGAMDLMIKLHKESRSKAFGHMRGMFPPGGRPLPPDPAGAVAVMAEAEAALRRLAPDQRKRLLEAAKSVHASGALDELVARAITESGSPGPKRGEGRNARRELRDKLLDEMSADPEIKQLLQEHPPPIGRAESK